MKKYLILVFTLLSTPAFATDTFPMSPDPTITPGSLCDKPASKRYPEGVPYCERDVRGELKREIMITYDSRLGYRVVAMERSAFKIDHYIPLCAGGSNKPDNLWPQHKSVYVVTDLLEQVACEKMALGKLRQADAVAYIKRAKANLTEAPAITRQIQNL